MDIVENRITIIENDGNVIFDSYKFGEEENMDSHLYRDEIQQSLRQGQGFSVRYSNAIKRKLIYYSQIGDNGQIIRVATDYSKIIERIWDVIIKLILFLVIFDVILMTLYNSLILEFFYKKINTIKKILEKGEPVSELYFEGDKILLEFWRVIKDWQNYNLKNLIALEVETEKLKKIISSIDIGILSLTENDEVILKNKEFEDNFMKYKRKGLYYECIKHIELIKFIKELKNAKKTLKKDITISDINKHYVVSGRYLRNRGIYIITVKDITKDKEFSEIQRRFITNISHELKTPLTNIKGYIIALEDAKDEITKKKFIAVISKNLDKIENMIKDFLSISKVENSKVINSYQFSIDNLYERLRGALNGLIDSSNAEVLLNSDIKSGDKFLNIDPDKILPVLKNLVENGIIYNNSPAPIVEIMIREEDSYYSFKIKDNGIGIPNNELEKIFERFYRVDKSRTKNMAGTGLGLSIVDEIIKIYNGKLSIRSEVGTGTEITISIPINI